jgi:hypothetical protein
MCGCNETVGGNAGGGGPSAPSTITPAPVTIITTDASNTVFDVLHLPVVGAWAAYELTVSVFRLDGTAQGYFKMWASAARNTFGFGAMQQGQIGPSGSEDPVPNTPWSAPGAFPGTWGINASVGIIGDALTFEFFGDTEPTAWTFGRILTLSGGATP